jgi:hypothetical protein
VGEREVAGRQVTRLAGKKASLHSSELCGRESCDSRDPEVGFQELMDGGVLMLMTCVSGGRLNRPNCDFCLPHTQVLTATFVNSTSFQHHYWIQRAFIAL